MKRWNSVYICYHDAGLILNITNNKFAKKVFKRSLFNENIIKPISRIILYFISSFILKSLRKKLALKAHHVLRNKSTLKESIKHHKPWTSKETKHHQTKDLDFEKLYCMSSVSS